MSPPKPSKKSSDTSTVSKGSCMETDNKTKSPEAEKGKKDASVPQKVAHKDKSIKPKKSSEKNDEALETSAKPDFSSRIQTLKSENEKMMKSMMDSMFDKWKAQLCELNPT